ncbi:MAG TPA: hypothetical protein VGS11_00715 [Candidatus Bathyarchaeia archaeon]|nr:hypothetical protein [Candidatus Bathyarchaeia archaeon]
MDSSTKRKVGAIALIVAGIGAFLVPFLLHGPALQASSSGGGNTKGNGGTTPTSSTCTTNCTPSTSCTTDCTPPSTCTTNCSPDTNPPACTSNPTSTDSSSHSNEGKHLAKGHDKQGKQDKPDTSLVSKAHGFMAALGKHNPQHDATHSTKTDNDTTDSHASHSNGHDTDDTNACADNKDNESSDDQGNDD